MSMPSKFDPMGDGPTSRIWIFDRVLIKNVPYAINNFPEYEGYLISPLIKINPSLGLIFVGSKHPGADTQGVCYYNEDKTYVTYFAATAGTAVAGAPGVYQRSVRAIEKGEYVVLMIKKEYYHLAKIIQSGVTLFDGSKFNPY